MEHNYVLGKMFYKIDLWEQKSWQNVLRLLIFDIL